MYITIHKKRWLELTKNINLVSHTKFKIPNCLQEIATGHHYILVDGVPIYVTAEWGGNYPFVLCPESLADLPNDVLDFSNWNIALLEETRPYIRSKYKGNYMDSNILYKTGHYNFTETTSGDQFDVFIWSDVDNWFSASYVIEETGTLSSTLIKQILNDRGSVYKESNRGSK